MQQHFRPQEKHSCLPNPICPSPLHAPCITSGRAQAISPIAPSTDQLDKQKTILTSSAAMLPQMTGTEAALYYKQYSLEKTHPPKFPEVA